ncbi:MAG: murein biosynthesis integral membrane protein MurJ, partial [Planctomycetota bacterium]
VTVRIFADTAIGSAFAAAFMVPNLFRRLLGEGALSAAFLPSYAQLLESDEDKAHAFSSLVVATLALLTGALTLLLEAVLLAVLLFAPGDPNRVLVVSLTMAMLPFMPLICVAAVLGGMLQTRGRFGPWAAAPIILNLSIIAACVPYFLIDGASRRAWAFVIAGAVVFAGAMQVWWSLRALKGLTLWTRAWSAARPEAVSLLRRLGPAILGLGTLQLNAMLDTLIAIYPNVVGPRLPAWLGGLTYPLDESSNAVIFYAQRLYQFPLGVFGIAVATVAFPALSRAANDATAFTAALRRALRLSLFIGIPASAGLLLVRDDLVRVVFTGAGGFSAGGAHAAAAILAGYAPAVWAYSVNHVLTRAFYARGDTATPVKAALATVGLNLALNVILIWPFREAGLAVSTAISATLQVVLLARWLGRDSGISLFNAALQASLTKTVTSTAVVCAAVALASAVVGPRETWSSATLGLVVAVLAGALAHAVASAAQRAPELGWLLGRSPPR